MQQPRSNLMTWSLIALNLCLVAVIVWYVYLWQNSVVPSLETTSRPGSARLASQLAPTLPEGSYLKLAKKFTDVTGTDLNAVAVRPGSYLSTDTSASFVVDDTLQELAYELEVDKSTRPVSIYVSCAPKDKQPLPTVLCAIDATDDEGSEQ